MCAHYHMMSSLNNEEQGNGKANISLRMSHSSVWNDGDRNMCVQEAEWVTNIT